MIKARLFMLKHDSARYQLLVVLGMVWLVLFVWYGQKMGMLSAGEELELKLHNTFAWVYSLCLNAFIYLCWADDYVAASWIERTAVGTQSELGCDTIPDKKLNLISDSVQPGPSKAGSAAIKIPVNALTGCEKENARSPSAGYSSPQIADMLTIRLNTVKAYNKNIYGKLGINSRPELFIKYADKI